MAEVRGGEGASEVTERERRCEGGEEMCKLSFSLC